jgi:hypothetical protein
LLKSYTDSCATQTGTLGSTGANAACKSYVGAYDMSGRVREWVDSRVKRVQISGGSSRFSWTPYVGELVDNGVDRLFYRFNYLIPPASGFLGLLMGSDYVTSSAYEPQVDAETQLWEDTTTSSSITGFRCMALVKALMPTADQLALPQESTYATADVSGRRIPESRMVGDTRPETVQVIVTNEATPEGKVQINWREWRKQTSSSYTISYDIYRILEPTHLDARFVTSWGVPSFNSGTSTYPTAKPLDPLAVDASGNPIFTKIATVSSPSSTNCTSTASPISVPYTPTGTLPPLIYGAPPGGFPQNAPAEFCYEFDYTGSEAAHAKRMYMYMVVAKDNYGNQMPAMVQRFRTPYLTGGFHSGATAPFRHEYRWRRAAIGPVAEDYQEAKSVPQVMVHVPMDLSGFDRDYYIHKYEAYKASGNFENNSANTNLPVSVQNPGSLALPPIWVKNAAVCYAATEREPSIFPSECGALSTTATFGSKVGVLPLGYQAAADKAVSFATLWKGCRNTSLVVDDGATNYAYHLHSPTGAEVLKAADWGDSDFNDLIDAGQNPYLAAGTSVKAVENTVGGNANSCYVEAANSVTQTNVTGSRSNCISRYGAVDLVGNAWEINAERGGDQENQPNPRMNDNGIDGLWFNLADQGNDAALDNTRIDLLRSVPPDKYENNSPLTGAGLPILSTTKFKAMRYALPYSMPLGGGMRDLANSRGAGRFQRTSENFSGDTSYIGYNQPGLWFGGRCAR